MSNGYFKFRKFTVVQDRCAMKVGTDGTLLGAWASMPGGGRRVLDIGTGTGLIALMMAQRFPEAHVTGIDIDDDAVLQARQNVACSPFASRMSILKADAATFDDTEPFDAIVSNPPYFNDALTCPDQQRTTARHTVSLSYRTLVASACKLLSPEGLFSVVIPADCRTSFESEVRLAGLFLSRVCLVKTTPKKQPKRQLIEFRKYPVSELDITEGVIEDEPHVRSEWYQRLTHQFYIR